MYIFYYVVFIFLFVVLHICCHIYQELSLGSDGMFSTSILGCQLPNIYIDDYIFILGPTLTFVKVGIVSFFDPNQYNFLV